MPDELRPWEVLNQGRAKRAFDISSTGNAKLQHPEPKKVPESAIHCGLHEGPKPPAPIYDAVKRRAFNQSWREAYRQALADRSAPRPQISNQFNQGMSR